MSILRSEKWQKWRKFYLKIKGQEIAAVKQQLNELQKKRYPKRTHMRKELSEGLYLHLHKKSKSIQPVINLLLNGSSSSGFYNKRRKKEKFTP